MEVALSRLARLLVLCAALTSGVAAARDLGQGAEPDSPPSTLAAPAADGGALKRVIAMSVGSTLAAAGSALTFGLGSCLALNAVLNHFDCLPVALVLGLAGYESLAVLSLRAIASWHGQSSSLLIAAASVVGGSAAAGALLWALPILLEVTQTPRTSHQAWTMAAGAVAVALPCVVGALAIELSSRPDSYAGFAAVTFVPLLSTKGGGLSVVTAF